MQKKVQFTARVLRETEKAVLLAVRMMEPDPVGYGGVEFEREAWVPKSLLAVLATAEPVSTDPDGVGIRAEVPEWFARQKNLLVRHPGRFGRIQEAY